MDRGSLLTTVVLVYFVALLGFGVHGYRRGSRDFGDFTLASKNLPVFALLLTTAATQHSMFVTVGAVGDVYRTGMVFLWAAGTWTLLQPLFYRHFGYRIWRVGTHFGHETPLDLFKERYHWTPLNLVVLATLLLFIAPYIAAQTIGAGLVFESISDGAVSFELGSGLLLGAMLLMVALGGMRAVAWSDVLQGLLTFGFLWIAAWYLLFVATPFPANELFTRVAEVSPSHLQISGEDYWSMSGMMALFALGLVFQPQLWQRLLMGRSPRANGQVAGTIALYLTLIFVPGFVIGLAALLLYPGIEDTDSVLPLVMFEQLPLWIAIPLVAGVLAAGMSTIDGILLTVSSMVTKDVGGMLVHDLAVQRARMVRVARVTIVALAMLAYAIALGRSATIVELTALGWTGPLQLLPAFIGAVYWRRGTREGALAGTLVGLGAVVLTTFVWDSPLSIPPIFWSLPLNGVVFYLVSLATPPTDPVRLRRIFVDALGQDPTEPARDTVRSR
jgi:solute:Na+ symporter, SSS family